jgi:mono/diheme cytochrome c family protein
MFLHKTLSHKSFSHKACRIIVVTSLALSGAVQVWASDGPGLGKRLKAKEIHGITVWPDGEGLPRGSGTVADGEKVYQQHCVACHGTAGKGGINDALVGGNVPLSEPPSIRTVGSYWPYATTLFDYIRRAMPYRSPGQLSANETYAVVAYLLHLNELIDENQRLDAKVLRDLKATNRARFYSRYLLPP